MAASEVVSTASSFSEGVFGHLQVGSGRLLTSKCSVECCEIDLLCEIE